MTIFCYHSVDTAWPAALAVTPENFTAQMAWLARHRRVVDLSEAVGMLDPSGRLPRGVAALTFDDGFSGVYEFAFPILRRFRLPATVFLVAQTLSPGGRPVDWIDIPPRGRPARTLSLDQVLELRDAGICFGSHSFAHRTLTELTDEECEADLRTSRELLESVLDRPVRFVAYPRGKHDARVRQSSERAGFTHGFTLPETKERAGRHAIPRVGIYRGNGLMAMRIKASRWYLPVRTSLAYNEARRRTGEGPVRDQC